MGGRRCWHLAGSCDRARLMAVGHASWRRCSGGRGRACDSQLRILPAAAPRLSLKIGDAAEFLGFAHRPEHDAVGRTGSAGLTTLLEERGAPDTCRTVAP